MSLKKDLFKDLSSGSVIYQDKTYDITAARISFIYHAYNSIFNKNIKYDAKVVNRCRSVLSYADSNNLIDDLVLVAFMIGLVSDNLYDQLLDKYKDNTEIMSLLDSSRAATK